MTRHATDLHQQVWDLLPWLANGSADPAQTRLAEAHLRDCPDCRAALAREQQLAAGLRLPASVAPSPEAGLDRLMRRIDQAGSATARPAQPQTKGLAGLRSGRVAGALLGIGLLELGALVALVAAGWRLQADPPASQAAPAVYQTLTSPAGASGPAARLRLVFDESRPVAELSALLQAQGLVVVAGPTANGVWSLGLPAGTDPAQADAAAQRLRQSPGVQFAEALAPAPRP